jgi:hypothetical protein
MKFVTYYASSGDWTPSSEKYLLLKYFSQGVAQLGDKIIEHVSSEHVESDVALIQGWYSGNSDNPRDRLRQLVTEKQLSQGRFVISADSNLFLYAVGKANAPDHYLRYSFNGVFANTGIYCDTEPNPARWKKISSDLGITVKPWRTAGSDIVLLLQRNSGWSMAGMPVLNWITSTIESIREYSDRPILIRAHPGDRSTLRSFVASQLKASQLRLGKIRVSENTSLVTDLSRAWATVNHNSSAAVGAAIEGVPVFVTDPDRSQCRDIANLSFSKIESPARPDRQPWLERISQFHWNFTELKSGECWSHMRQFMNPG